MNAFPQATEALLSAYRTAKDSIQAADFEQGALPLQQTALRELDVKIRQYEQQAGQSQPIGGLVIEPLVRRMVPGPSTEIAGVTLPILTPGDPIDPFAELSIENLTYDEMTAVSEKAGLLGFPAETEARIEHLKRVVSEGLLAPAVVEQRLKRNRLLVALGSEETDAILDSYGEDTVRAAGKYLLGEPTVTDREPKNVMTKAFVKALKEAQVKKSALDKAKAEAVKGGVE